MMRTAPVLFAMLLLALCPPAFSADAPTPLFDVPRLAGITVDGDPADWKNNGYRVELMLDKDGRFQPLADLKPEFRLAWDERGLLVLATVQDAVLLENADEAALYDRNSVEVFAAKGRGSKDLYQLVISPGITPEFPEVRVKVMDFRKMEPKPELTYEKARTKTANGYTMEILMPWKNLDITPAEGLETAFQIFINDADAPKGRFQAVWYPQTRTHENSNAMHRIRLSKRASAPERTRIRGEYDDSARTHLSIVGIGALAEKQAVVKSGRKQVAEVSLNRQGDYALADVYFPMTQPGGANRPFEVRVDGKAAASVTLPDAEIARAQRIMFLPLQFKPPIFKGSYFPPVEFANPRVAEALIGSYRIETAFYDASYNAVMMAEEPGRYGAVVDVYPQEGRVIRRFLTLYRAPDSYDTFSWFFMQPKGGLEFPPSMGFDAEALSAQSEAIGRYERAMLVDDLKTDQLTATLITGLHETQPSPAPLGVAADYLAMDRQWWVGLKQKLYPGAPYYPYTVVCPYQKEGEPARVLRDGTPEEAGMKPDAVQKIDAVLQAWAEESKEPFAVCLARHGVVYMHKAYGERFGQPMTVTTKSWMASISKFLSGTLMMTLVDQGLVNLEDPVDRFLPAFRGIDVKTPLTVRSLYTHTNGLQLSLQPPRMYMDHWGDDMNDLEEVLAGYYPNLEVGTRHGYNGVGYALGGKIIETISGEALPQYFMHHLWGPLGCANTDAVDGSARTFSVPMDIAKFGQLWLNKGAYGNMRFFSEQTYEKALPTKLKPYVHFDTEIEWGMGGVWMPDAGLSKKTFGHGAASAATLRIDPENDLVIVMTRNTAGNAYGKHHPLFIQAIVENMAGAPAK
ncbi:MAG: serine hydrolase [Candidatus Hydrogenedentales bacterium]